MPHACLLLQLSTPDRVQYFPELTPATVLHRLALGALSIEADAAFTKFKVVLPKGAGAIARVREKSRAAALEELVTLLLGRSSCALASCCAPMCLQL
jgi:hypothetical protein